MTADLDGLLFYRDRQLRLIDQYGARPGYLRTLRNYEIAIAGEQLDLKPPQLRQARAYLPLDFTAASVGLEPDQLASGVDKRVLVGVAALAALFLRRR